MHSREARDRFEFWRRQAQLCAPPPIVAGNQRVFVGNQIADAHTWVPREAAGVGNVSAQGDRLFVFRHDREDANKIAIRDRGSQSSGVVRDFHRLPRVMIFDPLD